MALIRCVRKVYIRASAFNGTNSAGVRCPWRFANLNNTGNAGLACENGNNTPSNSNWNSRPRLSLEIFVIINGYRKQGHICD